MLAVAAGILAVAYALWGRKTDEELLAEQLDRLAESVSFSDGPQNPVFWLAHLNQELEPLLAPDVSVEIPELGKLARGRADVTRLAAEGSSRMQSFQVELEQIEIQVLEGTGSARADATALVTGNRGARLERDRRPVHFGFKKQDGDWRVDSIVVRAALDEAP